MQGYGDTAFGPGNPMTRAEMATVLVRLAEKQGATQSNETNAFSDVEQDAWYFDYVNLAFRYGLISGYEDGTFRPTQEVTRAEAVAMINRLLASDYKTATELHGKVCPFPDVSEDYWAYGDIMEASVAHSH